MLRYLRAAGLTAAILTVAACGHPASTGAGAQADASYPGKTAAQVLALTQGALKGTTAVELDGTATSTGAGDIAAAAGTTSSISGPVTFSFRMVNGVGSSGKLSVGSGGSLKMLILGQTTYTWMDQGLLDQLGPVGAGLGAVLNGRWIVSDSQQAASFTLMAGAVGSAQSSLSTLSRTTSALAYLPAGSTLSRVAGKTINGTQTTGIRFTSPKTADSEAIDGTLYIAVTGSALPVGLERSGMDIQFSHWNQKVKIAKPATADVVSLDKLGLEGMTTSALAAQLGGQASGPTGG